MSEQKINVKLLREVKKMILEEPRRLDMDTWASNAREYGTPKDERPPCGTVACIAGWTAILDYVGSRGKMPKGKALINLSDNAEATAQELLGLTSEQAARLFDSPAERWFSKNLWPQKFVDAYLAAKTPQQRARVTASRIEHFIRTKGAE
jgi:hypothetical protein